VEILYEGHKLPAHFWPGRGRPGSKLPVIYNYGGADGILLRGEDGGAGQYTRRGMHFIDVDGPGHGGTLRHHNLYAPPDSARVAKAVIDYLVTRADVDSNRIGLHGSSMGGYSGPRCATVEKRIKAVAVWSGAYNLVDDIFELRARWQFLGLLVVAAVIVAAGLRIDFVNDPYELHNLYGEPGQEQLTATLKTELARLKKAVNDEDQLADEQIPNGVDGPVAKLRGK